MQEAKENMLQWHPAFFAGIQIELAEEAGYLTFESEHQLGTKPMQIDVLIIKKNSERKIRKNIGRIFQKYNIVEYKSPDDRLDIDDFYKVYGYACFYKADTGTADEIGVEDITLTFVCYHYPREMIRHLETLRRFRVEKQEDGIYYIKGDILPIQLLIVPELSEKNNLWLRSLTNNLGTRQAAETLICAYGEHQQERLYQSVMDIVVRSNKKIFQQEANDMCDALWELCAEKIEEKVKEKVKDKLDEREKKGFSEGFSDGERSKLETQIRKKLEKGKSLPVIADELEETEEAILPLYDQVKEKLLANPQMTHA